MINKTNPNDAEDISGFFFVDKPENCSSFDLIRQLRKITSYKKFGHTGTLDPFASGLVILCLNKATKLSSLIINSDKEYLVKMVLGIKTDTGDRDGAIIQQEDPPSLSHKQIEDAVEQSLLLTTQKPPIYSAKKIQGKAAYKYARQGKEIDLPFKDISIYDFNIISVEGNTIIYRTKVSKGTYVRTLSETFAGFLNSIAYTTDLRRLAVGNISVKKAVKMEHLDVDNWLDYLIPITSFQWNLPILHLRNNEIMSFLNGSAITLSDIAYHFPSIDIPGALKSINIPKVIIYTAGTENSGSRKYCLGIASIKDGIVYPQRVL